MAQRDYVHGYNDRERTRLQDQARTLEELLHTDTAYPEGDAVLEAGCGVGAQTVALARNSPSARVVAVDVSAASVKEAHARVAAAGLANVCFRQADFLALPFGAASFDHVFACFVLEHLPQPAAALAALILLCHKFVRRVIEGATAFAGKPGLSAAHAVQVEAVLAEGVDMGVQQRRGAGEVLVGDHVTLRAELRDDFADPQRVPDHHGVVQDGEAGKCVDLVLEGAAAHGSSSKSALT